MGGLIRALSIGLCCLSLIAFSGEADACAPPPPMTKAEAVRNTVRPPARIVYGEFVDPVPADPPFRAWSRMRVIHSYRGDLAAGSHVTLTDDTCMTGRSTAAAAPGQRAYVAIWPPRGQQSPFHLVNADDLFRHGLIKGPHFPNVGQVRRIYEGSNFIDPSKRTPGR